LAVPDGQDELDEDIKKDKGFFCSELVALLYKKLGLLPPEKSATLYWPGTFSCEETVDPTTDTQIMLEGEYNELSEEYEVCFDNSF